MIEVQGLHKSFPSRGGAIVAVDGVSFVARDGEITGLLGPNGAGKTTTLRMLYTLMQPDAGRVLVDGRRSGRGGGRRSPPARRAARRARALQASHGPREHRLFRPAARARRRGDGGAHRAPRGGARHAGFHRPPHRGFLAGAAHQDGHRPRARARPAQRAARRADQRPRRDDDARAAAASCRELRAEGRCVLLSSHVMQEVAALCDRIVVIAHGPRRGAGHAGRAARADGRIEPRGRVRQGDRLGGGALRVSAWWVVLRKELLDAFRDRRMVIVALVVMPLAVPLILAGMSSLGTKRQVEKLETHARAAGDRGRARAEPRRVARGSGRARRRGARGSGSRGAAARSSRSCCASTRRSATTGAPVGRPDSS